LHALILAGGPIYTLYGDLAYPQSAYLIGGIVGVQPISIEAEWNKAMASGQIAVE
jgi:hypothetical protein